ncbi:MAG: hypothetical protein ACOX2M_03620 [Fastidiosipilaceae bacterium]|jgi:hypothetical protein
MEQLIERKQPEIDTNSSQNVAEVFAYYVLTTISNRELDVANQILEKLAEQYPEAYQTTEVLAPQVPVRRCPRTDEYGNLVRKGNIRQVALHPNYVYAKSTLEPASFLTMLDKLREHVTKLNLVKVGESWHSMEPKHYENARWLGKWVSKKMTRNHLKELKANGIVQSWEITYLTGEVHLYFKYPEESVVQTITVAYDDEEDPDAELEQKREAIESFEYPIHVTMLSETPDQEFLVRKVSLMDRKTISVFLYLIENAVQRKSIYMSWIQGETAVDKPDVQAAMNQLLQMKLIRFQKPDELVVTVRDEKSVTTNPLLQLTFEDLDLF